jgi:coenzyme PQQ synthesis protein D (PqqD)
VFANKGDVEMDISLRDRLVIGDHVLYRQLEDEAVLLDLKSGKYFGLNDVGARAWQLILEHGSLSRVLEVLQEEYDTQADVVEQDLLALAGQLVGRKLADVKPNGG